MVKRRALIHSLVFRPPLPVKGKLKRAKQLRLINPTETLWYQLYVHGPAAGLVRDESSAHGKTFRRRFRVPWTIFDMARREAIKYNWFPSHNPGATDITGRPCVPMVLTFSSLLAYASCAHGTRCFFRIFIVMIMFPRSRPPLCYMFFLQPGAHMYNYQALLLLGCFRMLGRAVVYDEVAEAIGSSERVVSKFFKDFVRRWSRTKYDEWVCAPRTAAEFWKNEAAYRVAGFPGCGWSTDCVHLAWDCCPHCQRNAHVGKEGFPSLVFQVTFNHKRKILATTSGLPGAVNDKVRSCCCGPVYAVELTVLTFVSILFC